MAVDTLVRGRHGTSAMFVMIRSHLLARVDAELLEEARELAEELQFISTDLELQTRFKRHYAEHGRDIRLSHRCRSAIHPTQFFSELHSRLKLPASTIDDN